MNKFRQILALFIFVTVAAVSWSLYLKLPEMRKKVVSVARLPRNIDLSLRTVTYAETRDGVRKWVLEAQQADVAQKDNQIYLTKPHFVVYLQRKSGTVTVTAGRALYDLKNRNVTLTEKVVAFSDDGMNVETEKMFYLAERSLLSSKEHVRITHRNGTVEGDGMELQTVNGTVKLLRNVRATLNPGGVK